MLQSIKSVSPLRTQFLTGSYFGIRRLYSDKPKQSKESNNVESNDSTVREDNNLSPSESCASQLEATSREFIKVRDDYLKSIADFRNLQASTKREIDDTKQRVLKWFARDLMETVDHFDSALQKIPPEWKLEGYVATDLHANPKLLELFELYEGMQLTQNVLEKTLAAYGLTKFDPVGLKFDPVLHVKVREVFADETGMHPGTVAKVLETGFIWKGQCLRPAKVEVTVENNEEERSDVETE
ncbi:hypothetical protein NADFUDRAFT_83625 [Nadsonia fulvescens var. elongata DSM 6958]|uniref:GrpE protein homolog, mitochondrial n=1 Tax=Nadsonia fulvescens var. elongata DSM 6958 TaxID=857566 RepID=A0A1E3PH40_9ASCO|nr:hypothetical protein NADFUDRAFT_83625 [Nadsonia fulvescens var. elongata DSM 6958]